MRARQAVRAGSFYPAAAEELLAELEDREQILAASDSPAAPSSAAGRDALAALVPHAGWMYSGRIAQRGIRALAASHALASTPLRVVLFGAVHVPGVAIPSLGDWDQWETALGAIPVDRDFEERLMAAARRKTPTCLQRMPRAHEAEHSIEVELPMLQRYLPSLEIVPIAVPATSVALRLGVLVAELVRATSERTLFLASTDLTHYGAQAFGFAPAGTGKAALAYAESADRRFLGEVLQQNAERSLELACIERSACGGGATAALLSTLRELGPGSGRLLEYGNSHREEGRRDAEASHFVGYASVLFEREEDA